MQVAMRRRWVANGSLWLIATVLGAIALPAGLVAFAAAQPPGRLAALPAWAAIAATFVLLDAWKYVEHRAFHAIAPLWRAHRVHHSDTDVDVTTSERHHPLEVAASTALLAVLVAALGLPAMGLGVYLVFGTVVALQSHANLRLPEWLERALRTVVVTPDVHAIHHSALRSQTDSNFGQVLTIWDRLFGTYADPATTRVDRFGLEAFRDSSDATLERVLMQPFASAPQAAPDDDATHRADRRTSAQVTRRWTSAERQALVVGAAGLALVLAAMAPALASLVALWRDHEAYQYAWLVVPVVVYAIATSDAPLDPRPDWSGLPAALVAAVLWTAATLMNAEAVRQLALVVGVQAVLLSTLGFASYRAQLPALLLLFALVPCGDLLLAPLRALTLASIEAITTLAGLPHEVDGYVIVVAGRRYIVVDDCAGLVNVTLGGFVGYALGLFTYRSIARIAALSAAGALLGALANVARVNTIVLLDAARGSQMDLAAHGTFQWLALLGGLGALLALLWKLDGDGVGPAIASPPRPGPPAPAAACVVGLLIASAAAGLHIAQVDAAVSTPSVALPAAIAEWRRVESVPPPALEQDASVTVQRARYVREGRSVLVTVVEARTPAAKLNDGALRPDGDGRWRDQRRERIDACDGPGCLRATHLTFDRAGVRETRQVYVAYTLGGETVGSPLGLRVLQAWHRLTGRDATARMIGVTSEASLSAGDLATLLRPLDAAPREGRQRIARK